MLTCCANFSISLSGLTVAVDTAQAIDASPEDAALYSQRAQTHIKLENFIDAADDAGKAIELDPKTGRHHHRKG